MLAGRAAPGAGRRRAASHPTPNHRRCAWPRRREKRRVICTRPRRGMRNATSWPASQGRRATAREGTRHASGIICEEAGPASSGARSPRSGTTRPSSPDQCILNTAESENEPWCASNRAQPSCVPQRHGLTLCQGRDQARAEHSAPGSHPPASGLHINASVCFSDRGIQRVWTVFWCRRLCSQIH